MSGAMMFPALLRPVAALVYCSSTSSSVGLATLKQRNSNELKITTPLNTQPTITWSEVYGKYYTKFESFPRG